MMGKDRRDRVREWHLVGGGFDLIQCFCISALRKQGIHGGSTMLQSFMGVLGRVWEPQSV